MIKCKYKYSIYWTEVKSIFGILFFALLVALGAFAAQGTFVDIKHFLLISLALFLGIFAPNIPLTLKKRNAPRLLELHDDHIAVKVQDSPHLLRFSDIETTKDRKGVITIDHPSCKHHVFPSITNYDSIVTELGAKDEDVDNANSWWDKDLFPWKGKDT